MTAPPEPGWAVEDRLAEFWQVDPDPEVATHARTATLAAFTGPSTRRRRLRVPVAVAGCVLVSGVTGAWTAAAASSALPGDTAYGLKRAAEQVQLTAAGLGSLPGTVPGQGHLPTPRPTCPRSSPTRPPPGSIHLFPRAASLRPRSEGPMDADHPLRPRWNREEDPRNHPKIASLWFTSPVVGSDEAQTLQEVPVSGRVLVVAGVAATGVIVAGGMVSAVAGGGETPPTGDEGCVDRPVLSSLTRHVLVRLTVTTAWTAPPWTSGPRGTWQRPRAWTWTATGRCPPWPKSWRGSTGAC